MKHMVISYLADGSVEHILKDSFFKPGNDEQPRRIERLSEILPTDDGRGFYVHWLMGPLAGITEIMQYESYEEAVEHEIACVNSMRLCGYTFG
jgi:hypothetical protein